ncbi:MAG TPA: SDR family oxidoreductase [Phaeodactylibacter sp.]|nr:SDR family oxidoreductase [Phaeodactylibacter sp.]
MQPNVIITGATKGIGRAIAERFAPHSAQLALVARQPSGLEAAKSKLKAAAPDCTILVYPCDLSEKQQAKRLVEQLSAQSDNWQVLVNNAGLYLPGGLLSEPDEALEQMMRVNLFAPYYLSKGIAPLLSGKSHIFNLASVASRRVYPGKSSYSVTKFAMQALNDALRMELKERGVRVTAVLPGPTWSATWEGAELPKDRLLQAAEVAEAVWNAYALPANAVVEELVIQPQLGDL